MQCVKPTLHLLKQVQDEHLKQILVYHYMQADKELAK